MGYVLAAVTSARKQHAGMAALTLGALGVVFGDIGTSPLYALQAVFSADHHAVKPTQADVYGIISLVFWSITIIVSIKYVTLIMRADNDGEGGIMALIAPLQEVALQPPRQARADRARPLRRVAVLRRRHDHAGDLGALRGRGPRGRRPRLSDLVVPITVAIIVVLFSIQRFGTGAVGRAVRAGHGRLVRGAGDRRARRRSSSTRGSCARSRPATAIAFFADHPGTAFIALGAVVLAVTGAEALYADMGHFGRPPIRRAWFVLVFPALMLNYLGPGRADPARPRGDRQPVLPARSRLGAHPDGRRSRRWRR